MNLKKPIKRRFRSGSAGADVFLTEDGEVCVRTQALAARTIGISERTLREWLSKGAPRRPEGYVIRDLLKWDNEQHAVDSDDLLMAGGGTSQALERYRDERAKIAKYERLQLEKKLVRIEDIRGNMLDMAGVVRTAGEQIAREYGPGPQEILNDALREYHAELDAMYRQHKPDNESEE